MKRLELAAVMTVLVGAVLAASVAVMHRSGNAALHDLQAAQARLAQDTAASLREYLDSFDRDTRFLATNVAGARRQSISQPLRAKVILDAFQALATVVPPYRTIALFHGTQPTVVAVDPTEDRVQVAPALVAAGESVAIRAQRTGQPVHAGPVTVAPGRSFYLYAAPVDATEAVVVSSDAPVMLEAVARRATDAHGLVVIDSDGAIWIGCERRDRCRPLAPSSLDAAELMITLDTAMRDQLARSHPVLERLGLPARVVVGRATPMPSPLGTWTVAQIAPAAHLDAHQHRVMWQMVLTSAGVILAMLIVGLLILKQHARAAALRERLQAAEELARLQRQLVRVEKLATVGVLAAGIAHEIGTPLAVVRGRAEHMLERRQEGRDAEDLQAVVGEIDRISSTIRQVLNFSREEAVAVSTTDAPAAAERAVEMLQWRLAGKHMHVVVNAARDLPPVAAAADQLEQVLLNLLLNACDASPPDAEIRVDMRVEADANRLRIQIADRGAGIPAHQLNAVFDPYFTTKKRGEGTGLGLAIVWRIVRAHRGEIALQSTVGVGTVATVTWPTVVSDQKATARVA